MFFIHIGTDLYGKTDQVPGLFYVATNFVHAMFVPIIPLRSYIVPDAKGAGKTGKTVPVGRGPVLHDKVPIPMSVKSVLAAWLRGGLAILGVMCLVHGVPLMIRCLQHDPGVRAERAAAPWLILMMAMLAYWLTYRLSYASYSRALELADRLGWPPEVIETVCKGSRQVSPAADPFDTYITDTPLK